MLKEWIKLRNKHKNLSHHGINVTYTQLKAIYIMASFVTVGVVSPDGYPHGNRENDRIKDVSQYDNKALQILIDNNLINVFATLGRLTDEGMTEAVICYDFLMFGAENYAYPMFINEKRATPCT